MLSVPVEGRGETGDGEKGERACGSVWTCNCKPFVKPECEMPGHSYVAESHRQGDIGI